MKNLLLTLAVLFGLLLIGCQDSSLVDPIQDAGLQKTDDPSVTTGTIELEGMLQDPHPVMNSYYIISGEIQYQHTLEILDPIPPNPQYLIYLDLSVSANFTYLCTVCEPQFDEVSAGTILIETNDYFYVSKEGIYMLEKTFEIIGRNDGMVLKCSFMVTTDGIGLNEMWLALPGGNSTINNLDKSVEPDPVTVPPVQIMEMQ
jgi:hypothetical protein